VTALTPGTPPTTVAAVTADSAPALLREPSFRRYWSAQTISFLGEANSLVNGSRAMSFVAGPSLACWCRRYGVRPLGALAGGALGSLIGVRQTLWVATAGALLGVAWLVGSPILKLRTLPAPSDEST
jgi:hypothetical protein